MSDERPEEPQDERERRNLEEAAKEGRVDEPFGTSGAGGSGDPEGQDYEERQREEGGKA